MLKKIKNKFEIIYKVSQVNKSKQQQLDRRRYYQPQAPLGFKSRTQGDYFLASSR
ncbi:MAG: hypothetical protein WCH00_01105 [Candidatus Saccharibacteria bacterium]